MFLLFAQTFLYHAPRFCQQFLSFGSSFGGARLNAMGPDRERNKRGQTPFSLGPSSINL